MPRSVCGGRVIPYPQTANYWSAERNVWCRTVVAIMYSYHWYRVTSHDDYDVVVGRSDMDVSRLVSSSSWLLHCDRDRLVCEHHLGLPQCNLRIRLQSWIQNHQSSCRRVLHTTARGALSLRFRTDPATWFQRWLRVGVCHTVQYSCIHFCIRAIWCVDSLWYIAPWTPTKDPSLNEYVHCNCNALFNHFKKGLADPL